MVMGQREHTARRRPLGEFSGYGTDQIHMTISQKAAMFGFPVSSDTNYQVTVVENPNEEPYLEVRAITGDE